VIGTKSIEGVRGEGVVEVRVRGGA
jgi:hypothetical protein